MGVKKNDKRQRAEDYFIENADCTQIEVAALFGVAPKTICAWAKKYHWEDRRLDYHSSPVRIKQLLQHELMKVAKGGPASISADGISKLMAALDRCDRKADPIVVHKILKDLDNFISQQDPAFAAQVTPYHKLFLQHRINLEG